MAEDPQQTQASEEEAPKKKSKLPLLIGLVLALIGGGGGFFAVYSGLILSTPQEEPKKEEVHAEEAIPMPDVAFVPIEQMVINLGQTAGSTHLRFAAQLEVAKAEAAEVTTFLPRIVDVLNTYLRAIDISQIEDRSALTVLRSQMLRRVQLVVGPGRVRDLLIMEFVVN